MVLRIILGPEREEVAGGLRKLLTDINLRK
jgi:hypothetical protein